MMSQQSQDQQVNNWKGPGRVRTHLWKIVHGSLLTNSEMVRMGMAQDNLCPRCNSAPETIIHLLRDCEEVQLFWDNCVDPNEWSRFFSMGSYQWLEDTLSKGDMVNTPWNW